MRSDPFLGKICWLDKRDVRTGEVIPQSDHGVSPSGRAFGLAKRLELAGRRSEGAKSLLRRMGLVKLLKRTLEKVR